jgi:hypothetical protein
MPPTGSGRLPATVQEPPLQHYTYRGTSDKGLEFGVLFSEQEI